MQDKRLFGDTERFDPIELEKIQSYSEDAILRVLLNAILGDNLAVYGFNVSPDANTNTANAPTLYILGGGIFSASGSGRQENAALMALPVNAAATDVVYEIAAKPVRLLKDTASPITEIDVATGSLVADTIDKRDYAGIQLGYYVKGQVPSGQGWTVIAEATVNRDQGVTTTVDKRPALHTLLGARPSGAAGSHHTGKPGAAKQVSLEDEVQGRLPMRSFNLLESNLITRGLWRATRMELGTATHPATPEYPDLTVGYGFSDTLLLDPFVVPDPAIGKALWDLDAGNMPHPNNTLWRFQAFIFNPTNANITLNNVSFLVDDKATAFLGKVQIGTGSFGGPNLQINATCVPGLNILEILLWNKRSDGGNAANSAFLKYPATGKTMLARCNELGLVFGLMAMPPAFDRSTFNHGIDFYLPSAPAATEPPSRWARGQIAVHNQDAYNRDQTYPFEGYPPSFGSILTMDLSGLKAQIMMEHIFAVYGATYSPSMFIRSGTSPDDGDSWSPWDEIVSRLGSRGLKMWGLIVTDASANPTLYVADGNYTCTKEGSTRIDIDFDVNDPLQKSLMDKLKAADLSGWLQGKIEFFEQWDLGLTSYKYPEIIWVRNPDNSQTNTLGIRFNNVFNTGGGQVISYGVTTPANYKFAFFVYAIAP